MQDGIITRQEAEALRHVGAVGEITGWVVRCGGDRSEPRRTNQRVAAAPLRQRRQPARDRRRDGAGAAGGDLRAALTGRLISGLVTDEATAEHLLQREDNKK